MKDVSIHKLNLTLIINGVIVGAITGVFIEFFKYAINKISFYRDKLIHISIGNWYLIAFVFLLLIFISLVVGKMVKLEKSIGGSGIAVVKNYVANPSEINHIRRFVLKYIGSILVLSSGMTAGKVGPSAHFGAMVGLEIGQKRNLGKDYTILLVLSGIASGIASIFGAPLAGIMFVLEVITDDASENVLTVLLSGVASAYFVTSIFSGERALPIGQMNQLPFKYYYLIFVLIIISVLFSKLFNYIMLNTFYIMEKIPLKNEYLPVIPFVLTGVLYFVNENYVGFNLEFLMNLKNNDIISVILLYFVVKLFLTLMTFGSRVPGGLFFPVIFLGAVAGVLVFEIGTIFFAIDSVYIVNFIALGVVAFLTGVYKAPLTATVLLIELTGNFMNLFPVILVALFVQMGTDYLDVEPVHNLLVRYKHYFEKSSKVNK